MGKHRHHKKEHCDKEQHFTLEDAYRIGRHLGIDFETCGYTVDEYRLGMDIELEHGTINHLTNVTNDDPIITGKIALAHLNEFRDYYKRLPKMEEEAEKYWDKRKG